MSSAKEGGRTPTRVTSLEPEGTSVLPFAEESPQDSRLACVHVVTQKTAGDRRAPKNSGACTTIPNGEFRSGARVIITDGLAKGQRGRLLERAKVMFGDQPVWAVELPMPLGVRCIRADYLAREVA